jgi:hypothetical protein
MPLASTQQCYNCQQFGHYASSCTSAHVPRNAGGVQMLLCGEVAATTDLDKDDGTEDEDEEFDFSFHQTDAITLTQAHMIDPNWILLDSESTVSIFSNKKFLKNIRQPLWKQSRFTHP